jgi:AAA family ATP:ADP antiporter
LFLYTLGSTVLYFEQTDAVGKAFASTAERTEVLARMELAAQVLAVVTQTFLTGRVLRWIGVAATLAIMPAVSVLGFAGVGWSAGRLGLLFWVIVLFGVLRRGSNFALTNPAMEILFTAVDRPSKFKAKSFVETFVYRAGDQIAAWGYHGLSALGLSLGAIAWITAPLSAVFLALGVWLGHRHERLVD